MSIWQSWQTEADRKQERQLAVHARNYVGDRVVRWRQERELMQPSFGWPAEWTDWAVLKGGKGVFRNWFLRVVDSI